MHINWQFICHLTCMPTCQTNKNCEIFASPVFFLLLTFLDFAETLWLESWSRVGNAPFKSQRKTVGVDFRGQWTGCVVSNLFFVTPLFPTIIIFTLLTAIVEWGLTVVVQKPQNPQWLRQDCQVQENTESQKEVQRDQSQELHDRLALLTPESWCQPQVTTR